MALSVPVHSDMWKILQHSTKPKFNPGESDPMSLHCPQNWSESRVPGTPRRSEEPCLWAALRGIASAFRAWISPKSKSNKMRMEAKLWDVLAPFYLVLWSILVTLGFKLGLSRVCARCGLPKAAGERGIRKILLHEDCWAIRVREAVYLMHKIIPGELSCAEQKLRILFFFLKRSVCLWGRRGL